MRDEGLLTGVPTPEDEAIELGLEVRFDSMARTICDIMYPDVDIEDRTNAFVAKYIARRLK